MKGRPDFALPRGRGSVLPLRRPVLRGRSESLTSRTSTSRATSHSSLSLRMTLRQIKELPRTARRRALRAPSARKTGRPWSPSSPQGVGAQDLHPVMAGEGGCRAKPSSTASPTSRPAPSRTARVKNPWRWCRPRGRQERWHARRLRHPGTKSRFCRSTFELFKLPAHSGRGLGFWRALLPTRQANPRFDGFLDLKL